MRALAARLRRPIALPGRDVSLTLALLGALAAFFLRDALFAGRVLYVRDLSLVWYPLVEAFVRIVAQGSWPLWDPWRGFGEPLLADPRAELLYPPTWLNLIVAPEHYQTGFVLFHLVFAGAGTYVLARRWRLSVAGSRLAALVWLGSGPLLSLTSLFHHLAGASFMPWLLLATDLAAEGARPACAIPLAVALAAQVFAGSPDYTAASGVALAFYFLAQHVAWRAPLADETKRRAGRVAAGLALGLALSAAQWLPTLEAARRSERWGFVGQGAEVWALHPLALVELALPFRWAEQPVSPERNRVLEGREPFLASIYLGLPALFLAAAAGIGERRRRAAFLFALAGGSLLVALGHHTPAYGIATLLMPPLAMLRYPVKALALTALALALLTGLGFDALRGAAQRGRAKGRAPLAAVAWTLGLLAPVALAWTHRNLLPTAPSELFRFRPRAAELIAKDPDARVYVYDYSILFPGEARERPGVEIYRPARLPAGWDPRAALTLGVYEYLNPPSAERWGIRGSFDADILDFDPPPRKRLVNALREAEATAAHTRLLQMGGVTRVLALHEPGWSRELVPFAEIPSVFQSPIRVFQVPDPLPRAYVVGGARIADGEAALAILEAPGFEPRREIVLPSGTPQQAALAGEVTRFSASPDRLDVELDLERPGYLVLLESFDPGWRASVDGKPAEVLRANLAFRAVAVAEGRHAVVLRYRPAAVPLGLALSALGALATGLLWLRGRAVGSSR